MGDLRKFPILGTDFPTMLGRANTLERLWSDLTKVTPSNLSIIGPRYIGKTVIMKALAQKAEHEDLPYTFVLHWHLGHVAPATDDEFMAQLCNLLREKLATAGKRRPALRRTWHRCDGHRAYRWANPKSRELRVQS